VIDMQVFAPAGPPQKRPDVPSQPDIVPPQAVPVASPAVWQVPGVDVDATAPTQVRP
jgi:hypothetical protein